YAPRLYRSNGGRSWGRSLSTEHARATVAHGMENDRQIACRSVQVRFDHLQDKPGGNGGIKGIPALLKDRHTNRRSNPVGRSDHAERATDFWSGCKILHDFPCWYSRVLSRPLSKVRAGN